MKWSTASDERLPGQEGQVYGCTVFKAFDAQAELLWPGKASSLACHTVVIETVAHVPEARLRSITRLAACCMPCDIQ